MNLKGFIEDVLTQERAGLLEVIDDLTPEELAWHPGPEANHIGWMLWHMFRAEDMWIQFFIQKRNDELGAGRMARQVRVADAGQRIRPHRGAGRRLSSTGHAGTAGVRPGGEGTDPGIPEGSGAEGLRVRPQGKASRHVSQNSVSTADGGVPPAPGAGSLSQGFAAAGASHGMTWQRFSI